MTAVVGPEDLAQPGRYAVAAFDAMDRARIGLLTDEQHEWNRAGGPRIASLLDSMRAAIGRTGSEPVTVVNLSGLNEGKPDPVLFDLFAAAITPRPLSWHVVDHPKSQTFTHPVIAGWLAARGIAGVAHDHRANEAVAVPPADIVLCTEIVEHLDYTDTLALLGTCHAVLKPGGTLILTTPNALFLGYRLMILAGKWDFLHFNDEPEHIARGVQGHTIYYDGARMARLLRATGFAEVRTTTFNAGHGPGERRSALRRVAAPTLRALTRVVPESGQVLKVVAIKGEPMEAGRA